MTGSAKPFAAGDRKDLVSDLRPPRSSISAIFQTPLDRDVDTGTMESAVTRQDGIEDGEQGEAGPPAKKARTSQKSKPKDLRPRSSTGGHSKSSTSTDKSVVEPSVIQQATNDDLDGPATRKSGGTKRAQMTGPTSAGRTSSRARSGVTKYTAGS